MPKTTFRHHLSHYTKAFRLCAAITLSFSMVACTPFAPQNTRVQAIDKALYGQKLIQSFRYVEALSYLEKLVKNEPRNLKARQHLLSVCEILGKSAPTLPSIPTLPIQHKAPQQSKNLARYTPSNNKTFFGFFKNLFSNPMSPNRSIQLEQSEQKNNVAKRERRGRNKKTMANTPYFVANASSKIKQSATTKNNETKAMPNASPMTKKQKPEVKKQPQQLATTSNLPKNIQALLKPLVKSQKSSRNSAQAPQPAKATLPTTPQAPAIKPKALNAPATKQAKINRRDRGRNPRQRTNNKASYNWLAQAN